jgi:hypothetical protein
MSGAPVILALDQATASGYAIGPAGERPAVHGVHRLPPGCGDGEAGARFWSWFAGLVRDHGPDVVAFEAPIQGGAKSNFQTQCRLMGFAAMIQARCYALRLRCEPVANSTIKAHARRNGGEPGRGKVPTLSYAACMGFEPIDDNHADALTLHYLISHRIKTGRLRLPTK